MILALNIMLSLLNVGLILTEHYKGLLKVFIEGLTYLRNRTLKNRVNNTVLFKLFEDFTFADWLATTMVWNFLNLKFT